MGRHELICDSTDREVYAHGRHIISNVNIKFTFQCPQINMCVQFLLAQVRLMRAENVPMHSGILFSHKRVESCHLWQHGWNWNSYFTRSKPST